MKALNLIGERFGKLIVVKRINNPNPKKEAYWLAQCDCGGEICGSSWYIKNKTQCKKCKKGNFYKEIKELSDGSIEIIVETKKYGCKSIFIDKEDLEKTLKYWWSVILHHRVFYVQAWCRKYDNGKRRGGRLHQFLMGFPNKQIDHKDNNGLNNRKTNLRIVNSSQNAANVRLHADSTTGFKGVSYIPHKNLYKVQVRKDNKLVYWKSFKNPLIAAQKYNEVALKYHGEFALLNQFTEVQLKELANPPKETRRKNKNNKSGYIGVSLKRNGYGKKRFIATIYFNGKNKALGLFNTAQEAAKAYNDAALKLKGDKASLNIL